MADTVSKQDCKLLYVIVNFKTLMTARLKVMAQCIPRQGKKKLDLTGREAQQQTNKQTYYRAEHGDKSMQTTM